MTFIIEEHVVNARNVSFGNPEYGYSFILEFVESARREDAFFVLSRLLA